MRTLVRFAAAAATVLPSLAHASDFGQQGTTLVEGTIAASSLGEVDLSATCGAFVLDDVFVGGTLRLNVFRRTDGTSIEESAMLSDRTVFIGFAPRYYLPLSAAKTIFGKFGGSLGYAVSTEYGGNDPTEGQTVFHGIQFNASVGLAFALGGERGGLIDISLGFEKSLFFREDFDDGVAVEIDRTALGLFVGVGAFL